LNPSPGYYSQFNGYTLGLVCALLTMGAAWLFGTRVVVRYGLRGMSVQERRNRVAAFSSTVLARMLLVLYLVYPGVSVSIFGIFSCTHLKSGAAFLDSDMRIPCYDALHWRYIGAAIVWLLLVPLGVPAFFIWLLHHFKVPQMARLLTSNKWLLEAVQLAYTEGVPQPTVDFSKLNVDTIEDLHLEALYAYFLHDASKDEAAEILAGTRPPIVVEHHAVKAGVQGDADSMGRRLRARLTLAMAHLSARAAAARRRVSSSCAAGAKEEKEAAHPDDVPPAAARRALVLASLLSWCESCGQLALPPIQWEVQEEEKEEEEEQQGGTDRSSTETTLSAADVTPRNAALMQAAMSANASAEDGDCTAPPQSHVPRPSSACSQECDHASGPLRCKDLPHLQDRAMREVGVRAQGRRARRVMRAALPSSRRCTDALALRHSSSSTRITPTAGIGARAGRCAQACGSMAAACLHVRAAHSDLCVLRAARRETVELLRKLALTSILALIAPGSAGQVVVGLLIVRAPVPRCGCCAVIRAAPSVSDTAPRLHAHRRSRCCCSTCASSRTPRTR
jgi:hypothetical protein